MGAGRIVLVGKESNQLEDVRKGLVHDWDEVTTEFDDPPYDWWVNVIRRRLSTMTTRAVAAAAGCGNREARNLKSGLSHPHSSTRARVSRRFGYRADIFHT